MSVNLIFEVQTKPESIYAWRFTGETILPDTHSYDGCISVKIIHN